MRRFRESWTLGIAVLLLVVIIWAIPKMQTTIAIFFMAFVIAYLLDPLVNKLESFKIRRVLAILFLYFIILLGLCIAAFVMFPILAAQVKDLAIQLPSYLEQIYDTLGKWHGVYQKLKLSPSIREQVEKLNIQTIQKIGDLVQNFLSSVGATILNVISGLLMFLAAIIISMFLLIRLDVIRNKITELIPSPYRQEIQDLGQELYRLFGGFLRAQLVLCLIMGIGTALGLSVLKLFSLQFNYTLLISIMAGLGYAVPYIGSIIPMILGSLLGYFQNGGWELSLWVFLIQFIMYQLVNYFGVPVVMGKEIGVSPVLIIFAIFAGGELFGFWGVTLSVPAAAAIRVCFLYALNKWREAK